MRHTYKVTTSNGKFYAKDFWVKTLAKGGVKIISKEELVLSEIIKDASKPKRAYNRKKPFVTPPTISIEEAQEQVRGALNAVEQGSPTLPGEDNDVQPGDRILILVSQQSVEVTVLETYEDRQELKVEFKNGDKLVIPAGWFISKA